MNWMPTTKKPQLADNKEERKVEKEAFALQWDPLHLYCIHRACRLTVNKLPIHFVCASSYTLFT